MQVSRGIEIAVEAGIKEMVIKAISAFRVWQLTPVRRGPGPLADSWKQRAKALEYLGYDHFRDCADPCRLARPPI